MSDFPDNLKRLARIRVVSRVLKWACVLAMVFPPAMLIWALSVSHLDVTEWTHNGESVDGPVEPWGKMATSFLIGFIPNLALIWGYNQLRKLFRGFEQGRILADGNVAHLVKFGWAVVVFALARPVVHVIKSTIESFDGEYYTSHFKLDTDDLYTLLIGLLFCVLGWVMREGARIAEENAQIV